MKKFLILLFICNSAYSQTINISTQCNLIFFKSQPNEMNVVIEGVSCKDISVQAQNATLNKGYSPCNYSVIPKNMNPVYITVTYKLAGKTHSEIFKFLVKPYPLPEAYLFTYGNDSISIDSLSTVKKINYKFTMSGNGFIQEFKILHIRKDTVLNHFEGHNNILLNEFFINISKNGKSGDILLIFDIILNFDPALITLKPLVIKCF